MNIKQIKQQAANQITFERGVDYYEGGHVQNYQINVSKNINLAANVVGSLNNVYHVSAEINQFNELADYNCQCQAFNTYKGCCKHLIALLLHYYYDIDHKPTSFSQTLTKTDKIAARMISRYTNKSISEVFSDTSFQKVHLTPLLSLDKGKLMMSFTIGHLKTYILKSLTKFYQDMIEHNITSYGKNLTLLHDINSFADDSKELVKFVLSSFYEMQFYQAEFLRYPIDEHYLKISPSALDKFFDLYINNQVTLIENRKEKKVSFVEDKPPIVLSITPSGDDAFKVSINFKEAIILKGEKYHYLLLIDKLYRLENKFMDNVGILLQALMEKGESLTISHQDMSSFCVNVLPELKDYVTVDTDYSILEAFEPTPLTTKLFIDLEGDIIVATLKFIYDNYEFDAFDERRSEIYRNVKDELIAKNLVMKYFETEEKEKRRYSITDNELIIKLYVEGIEELSKYMQIYASDNFKRIVRPSPNIKIGVKINHNLLDIDIDTEEFPLQELQEILNTYRKNKKYYRLKDGSFIHLEDNSLTEFMQIADGLDLDINDLENESVIIPKYRALYLDNIIKNSKFIKSDRDNQFKEIVRDIKNVDDTQFIIPEDLKDVLRKYQKTGFRWLKTLSFYGFGGILADDMGLGKTIQVISLILSYIKETETRVPSLVVCPASLILNWELEFKKFTPNIQVLTIMGPIDTRLDLIEKISAYDVVITSYDYLKRDIDNYNEIKFKYHIIDEAQYIKNHLTQNAKSVKQIQSEIRFALTGTPIENNLAEIWSIFDFIMPGYLYNYHKFSQNYESPIIKDDNSMVLEKLKRLVTPFILRRLKKDVLKELPSKTETTMYANLEGEQRKIYLANIALIKKEVSEKINVSGFNQNRILILSMLTRLRQICCDPGLYYDNYTGESAKLDMCLELLDTSIASGHKILLFSQFTSMLAILKKKLMEENISFYTLQGSTSKEERQRLVENFNKDDTKVFLISLKAGGTGLNLTSADVVIHYDPWWNISAQNQATDRTHRIGQTEKVQVYKLIMKDTIEEKILHLQEAKQKLADSIIVEDDGIITKMTSEEILSLFE